MYLSLILNRLDGDYLSSYNLKQFRKIVRKWQIVFIFKTYLTVKYCLTLH